MNKVGSQSQTPCLDRPGFNLQPRFSLFNRQRLVQECDDPVNNGVNTKPRDLNNDFSNTKPNNLTNDFINPKSKTRRIHRVLR